MGLHIGIKTIVMVLNLMIKITFGMVKKLKSLGFYMIEPCFRLLGTCCHRIYPLFQRPMLLLKSCLVALCGATSLGPTLN